MKKITLLMASLAFLLAACFEDKGNYDYRTIGAVNIAGVADAYTCISMQDVLHIAPEITSDKPGDSFSCIWLLMPANVADNITMADTIGTDLVLDYPISLRPGTHYICLVVTNLASGGKTYIDIPLHVTTRFSTGLYLLKETAAGSELDLHLPDGVAMSNLLEVSTGASIPGRPVSLGVAISYNYTNPETMTNESAHSLSICTDETIKILRVADLSVIYEQEDMFVGETPPTVPYYMTTSGSGVAYISREGFFYTFTTTARPGSGRYGFPETVAGGCEPNPRSLLVGPFLFCFDDLNGRFLSAGAFGLPRAFSDLGAGGTIMPYAPNNIPHEILYFGHNFTGQVAHEGYAIFQDKAVPGKRYLYRLALSTSLDNPITSVTEIPSSLKFNEAAEFATNEQDSRLIYFLHDNKLYAYDVEQETEELLAPAGISPGEDITYFSNRYYINAADAAANFNYLAIATHQAGKYKVYLYETLGGKPLGEAKRVLEGDGKVRKMQYMTNLLTATYANDFAGNIIPLSI